MTKPVNVSLVKYSLKATKNARHTKLVQICRGLLFVVDL